MLRAGRTTLLGVAILTAAALGWTPAVAQDERACVDGSQRAANMANARVATAQQPATFPLTEGPTSIARSAALKLTLKPIETDSNSPFLVQVYVKNLCGPKGNDDPGESLGIVSFYLFKPGQPVDFVLPAPEKGFPSVAAQDIQLTVKLIPANPERKLTNTSVEVVKAQFAE